MESKQQQRKVVHVELREPYNGRQHWYFGSLAAIYDHIPAEVMGVSLKTIWSHKAQNLYLGKKATVRIDKLLTKRKIYDRSNNR